MKPPRDDNVIDFPPRMEHEEMQPPVDWIEYWQNSRRIMILEHIVRRQAERLTALGGLVAIMFGYNILLMVCWWLFA